MATNALIDVLVWGDNLARRGALRAIVGRNDPALIDPLVDCIPASQIPRTEGLPPVP